MSGFRPADAALEGFRITRENPRAFGAWVLATIGVTVLSAVADVLLPASVRDGLQTISSSQTPTGPQLLDALIAGAPVLVSGLAIQSIMAAAVYRLIFQHEATRFGYLRLGADELRLMALTVIYIFLIMGLVVGVSMLSGIVVAISSVAGAPVEGFVGAATGIVSAGVIIYVLVRLSLAPVATFAEHRLAVFESWTLTRGYFWPLLGAYALALACIVVIGILFLTIFSFVAGAVVLSMGGQLSDVGAMLKPEGRSLTSYLSVGIIAYMLVSSVFSALYNAVIASPGAVAYRELHGTPPQPWTAQTEAG